MDSDQLIARLQLQKHPEGGFYRETFRDAESVNGRAHGTAIYYLLRAGEESQWHRVDAAEIWHFYAGDPLELRIAQGSAVTKHVLGIDLARAERPQIIVPPFAWQAAKPLGAYTLVGCTVSPGFEFSKFELASPGWQP